MSHELVARIPSADEINRVGTIAENMAKSGLFPDAKSGAAAFAKIMLGRDLGLGAMQAMTGIHIVEGKPMLAATTLAGFVRRHPSYDYAVDEHDEKRCRLTFFDEDDELGVSEFTIEEARAAGLVKEKSGWAKYPKNMLFARAMSNGVKWFCPDLFGGIAVYTEGDEFERLRLTAGSEDGEARGVPLPESVEAVLARAAEVGHAGLADRATAEMAVVGRSVDAVAAWVEAANAELDAVPSDAEVAGDETAVAKVAEDA